MVSIDSQVGRNKEVFWYINNLTKFEGNSNDSFLALTLFTIQHEIMHVNKITKSNVLDRGENFL